MKLVQEYLDQIGKLGIFAYANRLLGDDNVTINVMNDDDSLRLVFNASQITEGWAKQKETSKMAMFQRGIADLMLPGMLSLCYRPMRDRLSGFPDFDAALNTSRAMNISKDVTWGVVHFHSLTGPNLSYTLTSQSRTRKRFATLFLQSLIDSALTRYATSWRVEERQVFNSGCLEWV